MTRLDAIVEDLEAIARTSGVLEEAALKAAYLLTLDRYQGPGGAAQIADDIRAVVASLPEERRFEGAREGRVMRLQEDARKLFPDRTNLSWSRRLEKISGLGTGDQGTLRWYARYLFQEMAFRLSARLEQSASDSFAWIEYKWRQELASDDIYRITDTREIVARSLLPRQEVVPVRHYYEGNPNDPKIDVLSANHRFIGRLPALDSRARWWDNFFHIARPYEVDEDFCIKFRASFRYDGDDIDAGEMGLIARSPGARVAELELAMPEELGRVAEPEWRIILNPGSRPFVLDSGLIQSNDGVYGHRFEHLEGGKEYRIAFKGTNPFALDSKSPQGG